MTYPTYPRPAYRPASSGYAYGPSAREATARVQARAVPVDLWGDLPGTPAYPVIETTGVTVHEEAGASAPMQLQPAYFPKSIPGAPVFRQNMANWFVAGEATPVPGDIPPTSPPPSILVQTHDLPPAQKQPDLPPPPTTIPDTPAKSSNTGWIIGGIALGVVALGGIVYLATRKTPRRRHNPRRRNASPRRRSNYRREEVLLLPAQRENVHTRRRRAAPKRRRNAAKKRRQNASPVKRRRNRWVAHHAPARRNPKRKNAKRKNAKRKNPAHCKTGMRVQTLVFPKSKFSSHEARAWARKHGYRHAKVDENKSSYRIRQRKPASFGKHSFRTVPLGTSGATGVVACPR